jgi:hypothetical protein
VNTIVTHEQPDVIGWQKKGYSILVEAKVSVNDFQRDSRKSHRRRPETGMGRERWYAFPEGFVENYPRAKGTPPYVHTLCPTGWGIIEFGGKKPKIWLPAGKFEVNQGAEKALLVRAVRCVTEGWGRRMFGELAEQAGIPKNDTNQT